MFVSIKIRHIARFLSAALLLQTAIPAFAAIAEAAKEVNKVLSYKAIGDIYLPSFGTVEKPQQPKPSDEQYDLSKQDFSKIPELNEVDTRKEIFNVLARYEEKFSVAPTAFDHAGMPLLVKDLELFFGQGKESAQHIFSRLDNTLTLCGQVEFAKMLSSPTSDVEVLQARQRFIKALATDERLFNKVDEFLKEVARSEAAFVSFWQEDADFNKAIAPLVYFVSGPFKGWNKSGFALGFSARSVQTLNILCLLGIPIFSVWGTGKSIYDFCNGKVTEKNAAAKCAIGASALVYLLMYPFMAKQLYNVTKLHINVINFLQKRLIKAGTFVRTAHGVLELADENSDIKAALEENVATLQEMFRASRNRSNDFENLFNDLYTTTTFEPEASFWSAAGRILVDAYRMREVRDQFAPLLKTVGELDAYLSMAKLLKKYRKERVGYCFVDFVSRAEKPSLKITNFWHPLIDVKKVVTNSVILGGAVPANILLTGSNTGGKSTVLKAMLLSILMAQTFGVAPADSMELVPYHYLGCYLHIQDDVAAGNSLFKAEVLRAQAIIDRVKSLNIGEFAFLVIDELFTGTAAEKGQQAAYKVAEHLMQNGNLTFIFATHFKLLTEMEQHHPAQIRNFKIDVYKDKDGNLVRPYKMEPGVSDQNIANDILQEEIGDVTFN